MKKQPEQKKSSYVKHKNGAIFLLTENAKNKDLLFLINKKNKFHSVSVKNIKQGLVNGEWLDPNEQEIKAWNKEYQKNLLVVTQKILKHVIVAELLIEIDGDLDADGIGDNYFRNLLSKSNKQAAHIADKHFDKMYNVDPVTTQNMLRVIEGLAKKVASLQLEDYPFFAKYCEEYFEDPKKYRGLKVEFIKPK